MRRTRRGLNPKLTITEVRERDQCLRIMRVSEVLVNTLYRHSLELLWSYIYVEALF